MKSLSYRSSSLTSAIAVAIFLIFSRFFGLRFAFISLFSGSFSPVPCSLFFYIKYVSIIMTETQSVCSWMVGPICIQMTRKLHIRNSNKYLLCGPGHHLVNVVELSLQWGHNTENSGNFRNTTVSNKKDKLFKTGNIFDIMLFQELCFHNTLIRNYYALFIFYLSNDKIARKIYLSDRFYVWVGRVRHGNSTPLDFIGKYIGSVQKCYFGNSRGLLCKQLWLKFQ